VAVGGINSIPTIIIMEEVTTKNHIKLAAERECNKKPMVNITTAPISISTTRRIILTRTLNFSQSQVSLKLQHCTQGTTILSLIISKKDIKEVDTQRAVANSAMVILNMKNLRNLLSLDKLLLFHRPNIRQEAQLNLLRAHLQAHLHRSLRQQSPLLSSFNSFQLHLEDFQPNLLSQ
jgi:hypothetical protein